MIKHSLRMKLTFLLVVLLSATLLISWILNRTLVEGYFRASEEQALIEIYNKLDRIYSDPKKDYYLTTERIVSNGNVSVLITKEDLSLVYPREVSSRMVESMLQFLSLIQKSSSVDGGIIGSKNEYSPTKELLLKGYTIQQNSDKDLQGSYLDLFGFLDDQYLVVIRSPLEKLKTGADISSRLFAYIESFMAICGSLAMFYVSKKFTEPIKEMANVATKMTNLDFEAKVLSLPTDEIGALGHSMNQLSMKLESTISELKTANNELLKDIDNREQMDEMRKEFISHVSHELKTPIALIQGYSEGLKDNINDDEDSKEFYCEVISDEARKMNVMVKKLLTLNQIEFGSNQVTIERFDIVALFYNLVQASDILYQKANATVVIEQEDPIWVWADEFMMEEVISNYLSNALHHLSVNGTITIRFEQKEDEVRIFVKNTGEPIPEEDIDKLWIKFYKVDKARTREYGGSGVGLSIVAASMEAHGKSYGVQNVEDGVEFYFDLDTQSN